LALRKPWNQVEDSSSARKYPLKARDALTASTGGSAGVVSTATNRYTIRYAVEYTLPVRAGLLKSGVAAVIVELNPWVEC
jgi:hypothetical protein